MDTKQIEYILKIAEENNITHAADKLFITQSALNQQLLKLEKELGTPLFHRSRSNWHLTEAGEIYVENARKILSVKNRTYEKIAGLASGKTGKLSVGFTPGRGTSLFTSAYKAFHTKYPNIIIQPYETNVRELQNKIHNEELDFAFVTLRDKEKNDDSYDIFFEEEIYLVLPSILPVVQDALSSRKTTLSLSAVAEEPFVLISPDSTMYSIVDQLFAEERITPNILFHTRNNFTILSMIQANLCCGLLPQYYIQTPPPGVSCFSLPSRPSWKFAVTYRRGTHLSEAANYFIKIVQTSSSLSFPAVPSN